MTSQTPILSESNLPLAFDLTPAQLQEKAEDPMLALGNSAIISPESFKPMTYLNYLPLLKNFSQDDDMKKLLDAYEYIKSEVEKSKDKLKQLETEITKKRDEIKAGVASVAH